MNNHKFLILTVLLAICICIAVPVSAGEKYLYGKPELTGVISGTNEFSPGDEVDLTIKVENQGLNTVKIVQSTIISRDTQPNTAKMVTLLLEQGDAPMTIKSDAQMVGDITGGSDKTVTFRVRFDKDAAPGVYTVPLHAGYTWLYDGEQFGTDTMKYTYYKKDVIIPLNIRIKSDFRVDVLESSTESVNAGTEGYLNLKVKNAGHDNARKAVIVITRNGNSPVIPTDARVYLGDFPAGSVKECRFKISVSNGAEAQVYPLDVFVEYEDSAGDITTSDRETIGVPVGGKIDFEVISAPSTLAPGSKKVIEVEFKNTGAATVYNAQARLSATDPFTSNDDTAFLGDLSPGDSSVARFEVSADSDATAKEYGLDSEIRYRDALDNSQISDTMKIKLNLVKTGGIEGIVTNPIVLTVFIFTLAGVGYYLWSKRKQE